MRYVFKPDDAKEFARQMGIQTRSTGNELTFKYCPYCKGQSHKDSKRDPWTFAISLKTGAFNCKRSGCMQTGNMLRLSQDFDFHLSDEFSRYHQRKAQYRVLPQPKKKVETDEKAVTWLATRGISKQTADDYSVTIHAKNPDVIVFPVFDENGTLVNIKYRNTKFVKGETAGSKEWFEKNCKPYIYGCQVYDESSDTFVITEGQMDALALHEAGVKNAFAVLGGKSSFTWFPASYDFLQRFNTCIVFGDLEGEEITLLKDLRERLDCEIKHIRISDYGGCKDANEILLKYGAEYLKKCVENAVGLPVKHLVDIADVETVDVFKLQKLETGLRDVDRLLYGGIPFGGICLIGGKAGEGKSTLASQILVHAISQGYICFAYSGELPNSLFKAWMYFQVAGPHHVSRYENKWGEANYTLSDANRAAIDNWMRGRLKIYDYASVSDENEGLLKTADEAIKRYGVKVLLFDNLMTAVDEKIAGHGKFEKQSNFMRELAALAVRRNVLILLVAHKRKNNFQDNDNENDDYMGSSDIVNLATLSITYGRGRKDDELEDTQRLLRITKNRLFGRLNLKGWVLDYDERCKRIVSCEEEIDREYGFGMKEARAKDEVYGFKQSEMPWDAL